MTAAMQAHLATGATHLCHCWAVQRRDGVTLGFTDHDRPLQFEGIEFAPENGLSARAVASTTGLAVNNSEALGVLTSHAISEADIDAGRYDGAQVTTWMVNWDDPQIRSVSFVGTIGELTRVGGSFQAELRGLTEGLNQPQGRSYLRQCSAVLGDARCRAGLDDPAFTVEAAVTDVTGAQVFRLDDVTTFNPRWFEGGQLTVLDGAAQGLGGTIKTDQAGPPRVITLWQALAAPVAAGDRIRLVTGCDKRAETCRVKFRNLVNFQGFPHLPGDDWVAAVPRAGRNNNGGSLFE